VFEHGVYEKSKAFITRRLAERGYFDADFLARRVEVTRAERAADIDLRWNSGDRYDMGAVTFDQGPKPAVRDDLLRRFLYWKEGDYYHQGRLDRLRKSLDNLDYFSRIDIEPRPEDAVDGRVPVTVRLTPAKRSIYSLGASYGTESGAGVSMGVERRYLNSRGHKALAQLDYAQKRKTLTLQYRVPAFAWRDGWYTAGLQFGDEQTDYIDSRRMEFVASRSGQYNRNLNLVASMHVLRERWAYPALADDGGGALAPVQYRFATATFPALVAEYANVDDRIAPRRGFGGALTLRAGGAALGSDANFAQVHVRGSWFRGLGPQDRLIVRGELGHTFSGALVDLPPSLRFYAGGDRSVRGYGYREIGPRIETDRGLYSVGAKNVVVASTEYERYFTPTWGAAVFVDSGSAFDGRDVRWRTGVGVGVRWKSPVGPLRIDLGHGLDDPDSQVTLHINLGADL
jgi:translocation and assembly module TamA